MLVKGATGVYHQFSPELSCLQAFITPEAKQPLQYEIAGVLHDFQSQVAQRAT